jgi:tRNA 2-thiouridine synthesizing protein B
MTLHTWNKPDHTHPSLQLCKDCMQSGDALLLLEDGVYLLLSEAFHLWMSNNPALHFFALAPDLTARGISDRIPPALNPVDYSGFVSLSLQHDKVVSWS